MDNQDRQVTREAGFSATSALLLFVLLGITLISISVALEQSYWKEFTKELGIVLLAVSGISLIYEFWVAESHFKKFHSVLKKQIETGETNAAICARLGIMQIYPTRAGYDADYPLMKIASSATSGSVLRIVARTLSSVVNQPDALKRAVEQGATLQFCCFDPSAVSEELVQIAELEPSDIQSAISTFRRQFVGWLDTTKPVGEIEIRFHRIHLLDSFFAFALTGQKYAAWDLSFGRDVTAKRVFLLDGSRSLYSDLWTRYDRVWSPSKKVFHYANKKLQINDLPQVP